MKDQESFNGTPWSQSRVSPKCVLRALILRGSGMETGLLRNSLLKAEDTRLGTNAIEMIRTKTIKRKGRGWRDGSAG